MTEDRSAIRGQNVAPVPDLAARSVQGYKDGQLEVGN